MHMHVGSISIEQLHRPQILYVPIVGVGVDVVIGAGT